MSYLDRPRLHFAGKFQADTATVNNVPANYDASKFTPRDALSTSEGGNGGWWPLGTGAFRLVDCAVTRVLYADGTQADDAAHDPLVGAPVTGADDRVAAKMADLDPEVQLVPQVWGMKLRLGWADAWLEGELHVATCGDLWTCVKGGSPGGPTTCGSAQTVLSALTFGGRASSRFLRELRSTGCEALSIRFLLDGFDEDCGSPDFTLGRIVGTIGPARAEEPRHSVLGRMLRRAAPGGDDSALATGSPPDLPMWDAPCVVDRDRRKVVLDVGHSLSRRAPGGPCLPEFDGLELAVLPSGTEASEPGRLSLGALHCSQDGWYEATAGIAEFPVGRPLSDEEWSALEARPLALVEARAGRARILLRESVTGLWISPETQVVRMEPDEEVEIAFRVTRFGVPEAGLELTPTLVNNGDAKSYVGLAVSGPASTDDEGRVTFRLRSSDPGNPRRFLDGQIFYVEAGSGLQPFAIREVTWVHVYDRIDVPERPTWWQDVRPILLPYANLFPVMKEVLDLSYLPSVLRHRDAIRMCLALPPEDPNHMPVTRDLSQAKRDLILTWLADPVEGQRPAQVARVAPAPQRAPLWRPRDEIRTVEELKLALQGAIHLEHATIPPYLCALFSIRPGRNHAVASALQRVAREEMLHMALACNVLNAIGGRPTLDDPELVPRYPGPLPLGVHPDLVVRLEPCSLELIRDTFLVIEEPEQIADRAEPDTIGGLYRSIVEALARLDDGALFCGDPRRQVTRWRGPGRIVEVTDLASARAAIEEIRRQGEGATPWNPADGEGELAHYYRFQEIVHGRRLVRHRDGSFTYSGDEVPFDPDGVWPMRPDPRLQDLKEGSRARRLAETFASSYGAALRVLQSVFDGHPEHLDRALGLMVSLRLQAHALLRTELPGDAHGAGLRAGPCFERCDPARRVDPDRAVLRPAPRRAAPASPPAPRGTAPHENASS